MKILFMGTPEFAIPSLKEIYLSHHKLLCVFTRLDKPRGRGIEVKATPVGKFCEENSIPLEKVGSLKKPEVIEKIKEMNPDAIVVVAFGAFLPSSILSIPKYGCINLHPSVLPKYRGPSPIQYALLNGDRTTGVTTMLLDEGMDSGPLLLQEEVVILPIDDYGKLSDRLSKIGAKLLLKTLEGLENNKIKPKPQDHSSATFTKKLEKNDFQICWANDAERVDNSVRAFNPPGAFTYFSGKILKILQGEVIDNEKNFGYPGSILEVKSRGIDIACGKGAYRIKLLQLEGKKPCLVSDFINGHKVLVGEIWK